MKLHTHLIFKIVETLETIFFEQKYADKVLEKTFKQNRQLGSRDRKFYAETTYEVVRHKRFYEEIMKSDDVFDLVVAHLIKSNGELPNDPRFDDYDVEKIKSRFGYQFEPEVAHSFPNWLHELGKKEFNTEWPFLMKALNQPAEVYLRCNTLKIQKEDLIQKLKTEEIEALPIENYPDALKLKQRKNVFITKAFQSGFFEVQDAASQQIGPLLNPKSGDRVVDACAGAGGKSLHLAALMKNKGKIISMDIHDWKLQELRKRASRNGVDIIETKVIENSKTIKRFEKSFDKVLLDVPCSGLGVLRRNPDTKWKLSQEEIDRLILLQREIISTYSKMAKDKGVMVYATCSILHAENENQVQWFLNSEEGKGWTLEKEIRSWPHKDGFDGFYAARLVRS